MGGYTWCEPLQECIRPWEIECNTTLPGGDTDSHGCIPSAGYTWCDSMQECIRPWETECYTAGGDTDSKGCIPSAGYTWCESLQECIRPWETECDTPVLGGDTDSHGCIPSAGYTWCEPLQECIRPWETDCDNYSTRDDTQNFLKGIAMKIASELSALSTDDTTTAETVKEVTENVISQQDYEDDVSKAIMDHILDAANELVEIHSDGENESIASMVSELMMIAVGTDSDATGQVADSISNVVNNIFNP